jgi:hypothetical protein
MTIECTWSSRTRSVESKVNAVALGGLVGSPTCVQALLKSRWYGGMVVCCRWVGCSSLRLAVHAWHLQKSRSWRAHNTDRFLSTSTPVSFPLSL